MCPALTALEFDRNVARATRDRVRLAWALVDSATADVARGQAAFALIAASSDVITHMQHCPVCRRDHARARLRLRVRLRCTLLQETPEC